VRLKSRLLSLFLVVVMLLGSTPIPTIGSEIIRVTIDGIPLSLDVPPVVMSGRTLVPLRAIFEALGASVTWDDAAQRIAGARGSRTIVLYLGRNVAYIDGAAVTLDVAPAAVRGRTMVPARFVAESLGATVSWNEATLTMEITRAIPVASLSLNLVTLALVVTDAPAQLTATVLPPNATDQRLIWRSSDPSVATVSPAGLATPMAPGRAHITVTSADGSRVATSEVTVAAPIISVTGIALSHASHTLRIGETLRLVATISPPNATTRTVSWLSTNPTIASVSNEGLVTAHRVGTTRITATSTDGSRVATCEVTVQAATVVLSLTSMGATAGSGNHLQGATGAVSTTVPVGQRFVNWSHGTTVVSTSPSFTFTLPAANVSLVANFRAIVGDIPTEVASFGDSLIVFWGTSRVDGALDFLAMLRSLHPFVRVSGGGNPLVVNVARWPDAVSTSTIILLPPVPGALQELRDLARSHPELTPLDYAELRILLQSHPAPFAYFSRVQPTGRVRGIIVAERVDGALAELLATRTVPLDVVLPLAPTPPVQVFDLMHRLWAQAAALQAAERQSAEQAQQIQALKTRINALETAAGVLTEKTIAGYVDPYSPTIKFCALGITLLPSDVLKLRKKGEDIAVAMQVSGSTVFIGNTTAPQSAPTPPGQNVFVGHAGGSNVLDFYQDYVLTVYQATGHRYEFSFATSGLPLLANESPIRQIILIPAMPEKGFYWPYLLAIPHIGHRAANVEHRRYLMVDGTNTGRFGTFAEAFAMTKRDIANGGRTMVRVADALWSPLLIPVFPRPLVDYVYGGEVNRFYTHALDRDSVLLRSRMKDPILRATLIRAFAVHNINVQHLERLDLQLIAMIDHAVGYLNSQRFDLEPDKIFMYGFSASGDFSKRFSTLHPERIRAVYSGAAINSMMLPLAQHRGKNLIYPIGVYDYKAITGRDFCMARHNQVARLLHRGDQDTNEPLHFPADYSARERAIVIALWGAPMQPRIRQLIELYGQSGGHGMFILDRGIGHGESPAMVQFIIEFFKANRDGDVPVYPIPSNPAQLMYTLFQ